MKKAEKLLPDLASTAGNMMSALDKSMEQFWGDTCCPHPDAGDPNAED